jgi:hypothetical protein
VYKDFSSNGGEDLSVLRTFAIQTHELFVELMDAGFNEEQAIKVVVGLVHKE